MKKGIIALCTSVALGLSLAVGGITVANAHTPEVTATCDVLTVTATNYEEQPEITEQVIDTPEIPGTPGTPEVPAVYETVIVTPATPDSPEEGYTKHQYQKQVKGFIEEKIKGKWEATGSFDWKWYVNVSTQWSNTNVEVLQSGPHSDTFNETNKYRETSTHYRYVKNGVTQYVKTKDAVPGTPAVTEQRLVTAAIPAVPATPTIPATYKTVVTQAADSTPNSVVVTIDGTEVDNQKFGTSFSGSYNFPTRYESHDYSVTITAWNDPDGSKGYTKTFTGKTTPCVPEYEGDRITYVTTPLVPDCELKTVSWELVTYTSVGTLVNGAYVYGEPVETSREPNTRAMNETELAACPKVVTPPVEPPVKVVTPEVPAAFAVTGVEDWYIPLGIGAFIVAVLAGLGLVGYRRHLATA